MSGSKNTNNNPLQQAGFTLLETVIVIVVSAGFMIAAAQFVKLYNLTAKREATLENAAITQAALREFFVLEGRYPCPADPTLASGDANYGLERCRNYANVAFDPDSCTNVPLNILCYDQASGAFSRDGDGNGTIDVVTQGIIPFRTLYDTVVSTEYREFHKKDGYGQVYSYAVTEHMTNSVLHNTDAPVNPRTGSISVLDENRINLTIPDDSAHYVLFSHGDNGRGGHTADGRQIDNCMISVIPGDPPTLPPSGINAPGIPLELENCDTNDAIYIKGIRSMADTPEYYDDMLFYNATGLVPIWRRSLASGPDTWLYNTNLENVGIGTDSPTHLLHIDGNLRAESGILSTQYCIDGSDGTSDCLNPDAIAGDISSMRCSNPRQVAYAIHENTLLCRDIDWTPVQGTTCPAGQFLNGFSNLGRIRCCDPNGSNCQILP